MFKLLIPAAAALALVVVAAKSGATDAGEAPVAPAMAWRLTEEGQMLKLSYGVENSDELALMMTCSPGDRSAAVYGDVRPQGARMIQASMGDDALAGEGFDEGRIGLGEASMRRLVQDGRLSVVGEAGSRVIPASSAERAMARRFVDHCASAHA